MRSAHTFLQHCSSVYTTVYYVANIIFFIVECGIARFLCDVCVFEVQASSSSPGYLCAKFHFFC